jgi:predicted ribosomally synthesized peptide with SipW-like signal peptide
MAHKWIVGVGAALALIIVAGSGFAAFTASATVNGKATAGTVGLAITATDVLGCYAFYGAQAPGPGNISFSGLNEARNSVTLTTTNLTPSAFCDSTVTLENTGSVPENLSVVLNTPGANGVCAPEQQSCFEVYTVSGITEGWVWWDSSPTGSTPTSSVTNIVTLAPGASYTDWLGVAIPPGANNGTPSSATFSLVYTATAGY